jgi:hypothetical protein
MAKLRGWSRQHANGWFAEVREAPYERAGYQAFTFPPPEAGVRSTAMAVVDSEQRAKTLADHLAHPGCTDPDACAGAWVEYSSD